MAYHEKGEWGKGAHDYAQQKALERITGARDEESNFSNRHTERGNEQEGVAINLYSYENIVKVDPGGFYDLGLTGSSPDGLIGDKGQIQVKCVIAKKQWERHQKGGIDPAYRWQIQKELWDSGREWNDYVQYCSAFPEGAQLYVCRVEPDLEDFKKIEDRTGEFEGLIQEKVKFLRDLQGEDTLTELLQASIRKENV
jgi:hypothetical protein